MAKRPKDFRSQDVHNALLWCGRRCCLCGKQCGIGIELAHLDQSGSNDLDNGIPVCFDCHLSIGGYNDIHPRGRKLRINELKARRDQMYEQQTSHLVPRVRYEITQNIYKGSNIVGKRTLPDVGFWIFHEGGPYPVKVRVSVTLKQGTRILSAKIKGHYDGTYLWNLNPGFGVNGHFEIPGTVFRNRREPVKARVDVVVIDIYSRPHPLLPVGYVHCLGESDSWFLEPSMDALNIRGAHDRSNR